MQKNLKKKKKGMIKLQLIECIKNNFKKFMEVWRTI